MHFLIPQNLAVLIISQFGNRKLTSLLRAVMQDQSHLFLGCGAGDMWGAQRWKVSSLETKWGSGVPSGGVGLTAAVVCAQDQPGLCGVWMAVQYVGIK